MSGRGTVPGGGLSYTGCRVTVEKTTAGKKGRREVKKCGWTRMASAQSTSL